MTWRFRRAVPTTKKLHLQKTGLTALKARIKHVPRAKRVLLKSVPKARKVV